MTPPPGAATERSAGPGRPPVSAPKPRMVFLVTEYYFFHAMRKDLASAAAQAAFDIVVVAYCGNSGDSAATGGFRVIDFSWRRSNSLWRAALQFGPELLQVRRLLRDLAPDVLHNIALKPTIIGTLASAGTSTAVVNTLTGFGFLFFARGALARFGQVACARVLRWAALRHRAQLVVHNTRDQAFATGVLGLPPAQVHLVRGLGIDTDHFAVQPPPAHDTPFRVLMIARWLFMKGLAVAVEAIAILQTRGRAVELTVCGGPDVDNPSAIPADTIAAWGRRPGIRFLGQVADVRPAIAESHVVMHPALGGEGLPRVLLEGSACGRPLIATDISGNSDIVVDGENGRLVPPGDPIALADAIAWMMDHPTERARLAANGRTRVVALFASNHVAAGYMDVYRAVSAVRG